MPQRTVYIRNEDVPLWDGVIRKSEFIHNALQDRSTYDGSKIVLRETLPVKDSTTGGLVKGATPNYTPPTPVIKTKKDAERVAETLSQKADREVREERARRMGL